MAMQIHCPQCSTPLTVPQEASGRRARCPLCRKHFTVPSPDELVEETISCWIEEAVDAERQAHEQWWDQTATLPSVEKKVSQLRSRKQMLKRFGLRKLPPAPAPGSPGSNASGDSAESEGPVSLKSPGRSGAPTQKPSAASTASATPPASEAPPAPAEPLASSPPPPTTADREDRVSLENAPAKAVRADDTAYLETPDIVEDDEDIIDATVAETASLDTTTNHRPAPGSPGIHSPGSHAPGRSATAESSTAERPVTAATLSMAEQDLPVVEPGAAEYPTDLFPEGRRAHLVVREVTQSGVVMQFDSCWLEDVRFRASMPMWCMFSGTHEKTDLIAKPLAFIDRSQCKVRSPREVERNHETYVTEKASPRDLLSVIGLLENLPQPFNRPMPYYTHRRKTGDSLVCLTRKRDDGGLTCEVIIPDGAYALDWLVRVNGVCGPEYELLARDVQLMGNDAWAGLSEQCRQRLAVWAHFARGEAFRLYISDADFGKKDEGLAGLVVTDRRLIYHKYHHNGELPLNEPITFFLTEQESITRISAELGGRRLKIGDMLRESIPALQAAIGDRPNVRFEQSTT